MEDEMTIRGEINSIVLSLKNREDEWNIGHARTAYTLSAAYDATHAGKGILVRCYGSGLVYFTVNSESVRLRDCEGKLLHSTIHEIMRKREENRTRKLLKQTDGLYPVFGVAKPPPAEPNKPVAPRPKPSDINAPRKRREVGNDNLDKVGAPRREAERLSVFGRACGAVFWVLTAVGTAFSVWQLVTP